MITPMQSTSELLTRLQSEAWSVGEIEVHPEETFFESLGLSKAKLAEQIDVSHSLYSAGWFYQQLLKLGAWVGIDGLSEDYLVWDSDLLPIDTWPVVDEEGRLFYALLQHNSKGNPDIVGRWERWIREVLGVEPIEDDHATFVPHHMWFSQPSVRSLMRRLGEYYESDEAWPVLMMRSANDFGTFSEYWLYASWVAATPQTNLNCYSYDVYGSTTERFFDDGTGPFSTAMHRSLLLEPEVSPSYEQVSRFIAEVYTDAPRPSSIAFEQNPRHIKKDRANMHLEEVRSRWHAATLD